jgi:hypothetical protein
VTSAHAAAPRPRTDLPLISRGRSRAQHAGVPGTADVRGAIQQHVVRLRAPQHRRQRLSCSTSLTLAAMHMGSKVTTTPAHPARSRDSWNQGAHPVGWGEPGPIAVQLPLEGHDLASWGEDLGVLVPVTDRQQPQQGEGVGGAEVGQSQQPDSCWPATPSGRRRPSAGRRRLVSRASSWSGRSEAVNARGAHLSNDICH